MKKPKVIVLRTAGTNCDVETASAFQMCGALTDLVHINELVRREKYLDDYQILALPGGFTYGDDIASGKILANEMKYSLGDEIKDFINSGKLAIGICNGFQVLVKAGILPGINNNGIEATLSFNDSGKFEDRWVYLRNTEYGRPLDFARGRRTTKCVWTKGIKKVVYLPVAHGEGKFIPKDKKILSTLKRDKQIVFQYVDEKGKFSGYPYNPNASVEHIAGICDPAGRVLGMMPHPERHILGTQHPRWTREGLKKYGDGLEIFKNGVRYVKEKL
ncbi:MAG: phosphoribosylformylglycinamidine synthase I [Candidatus Omnitrophica bacterium]|nr:phosphoribosylformylglycinamidine synthase I [Candidatus Omnitrophota bacterium]MBU4458198.1 phosphoribosylformylglycinamidine synthase I [Candidatus Omnitrophota bacterium]